MTYRFSSLLITITLTLPFAARGDVVLFSGGFLDPTGQAAWNNRFGNFHAGATPNDIVVDGAVCVSEGCSGADPHHAEAQHVGVIGTDFVYSASVTLRTGTEAHLQFRVADEGRFGVRLTTSSITAYDFHVQPLDANTNPCSNVVPSAITHCPNWTSDLPQFEELPNRFGPNEVPLALTDDSSHDLVVIAQGSALSVFLDGALKILTTAQPYADFRVGRFGLYAYGTPESLAHLRYSNVRATTNPSIAANFALLYSAGGYDLGGTKRALVRTLTDLPLQQPPLDIGNGSQWVLKGSDQKRAAGGLLRRLPGKTFGMQLWEADFSSVSTEGMYTLEVDVRSPATGRITTLTSAPFEIRRQLFTTRLLKPMSLVNAEVRRGADEDFWRNWIVESGSWKTGVDGAFIADRADADAGWTLTRVFNFDNTPLDACLGYACAPGQDPPPGDFRFVGRVTIVNGCDAQLRFQDTAGDWWAVTLQAESAGGCPYLSGPGAVRLSQEHGQEFLPHVSAPFPIVVGHPYDIEVVANGQALRVYIDQTQGAGSTPNLAYDALPNRSGRFGLKAWASTVRFEDVQAWKASVRFVPRPPGSTRIPTFLNQPLGPNGEISVPPTVCIAPVGGACPVPCQYAPRRCVDTSGNAVDVSRCRNPVDPGEEVNACYPAFSMLHGFHDSSSEVAEGTSHGVFLSGLMQVWKTRAGVFTQADKESLRRAIVANVLYLDGLYEEGGATGQFAHSEMGRITLENDNDANTMLGMYALADFADAGLRVDAPLARAACFAATRAAAWWFPPNPNAFDPDTSAIAAAVFARLDRCTTREGLCQSRLPCPNPWNMSYLDLSQLAANRVVDAFQSAQTFRDNERATLRAFPWFEGVWEVVRTTPALLDTYQDRLKSAANVLVSHLTETHPCDDVPGPRPLVRMCPPNGFYVVPQASGDMNLARANWIDMEGVPLVEQHSDALPFLSGWYNVEGHFPTTVTDAALLGRLTGNVALEKIATGSLYWLLGLNPGIPASKAISADHSGDVWKTSAFLWRLDGARARAQDGLRINLYTAKGWLDDWEDPVGFPGGGSPWREAWRIDPQNRFQDPPLRSLLTTVNGHVIWDGQWDYWNTGPSGWVSGETFILGDGAYLKGAVLLEDWLTHARPPPLSPNPYDTARLAFFDTTHVDRFGTGWGFDDPDTTPFSQASRTVHQFCTGKGFTGGRFTGHHLDERVGALCVSALADFYDATDDELRRADQQDYFDFIDATPWAQEARVASSFCVAKQTYVSGFFTGHQVNGLRGVVCLASALAQPFDVSQGDLDGAGLGPADINSPWALAGRVATNICLLKGYPGGYFDGQPVPGPQSLVCLRP